MTVTLLPLPDGIPGDEAERLQQIIAAIRGFAGQGIQFNLTEYSHATKWALQVRNEHTAGGGRHFAAFLSSANVGSATPIFSITDAGVTTGNLTVNEDLVTLDDATIGGTLFVDEGVDIIGGGIISGAVTFTGAVTINDTLDVDTLVVNGTSTFGDQITVSENSTEAIRLRNTLSSEPGYWKIGASSSATPNFQIFGVDDIEKFEITETGRINARSMEIYDGHLRLSGPDPDIIADGNVSVGLDLAVTGDATVAGDLEVGTFEANGVADFLNQVFVQTNNSRAILFRNTGSSEVGYWSIGASSSATPNFQIYGVDNVQKFEITETGRINARSLEIYGPGGLGRLFCSDDTAASEFDCTVDFDNYTSFGGSLTTGEASIIMTNNTVINFDYGSGSGFATSDDNGDTTTWGGHIRAQYEGAAIRIPFHFV